MRANEQSKGKIEAIGVCTLPSNFCYSYYHFLINIIFIIAIVVFLCLYLLFRRLTKMSWMNNSHNYSQKNMQNTRMCTQKATTVIQQAIMVLVTALYTMEIVMYTNYLKYLWRGEGLLFVVFHVHKSNDFSIIK